MTSAFSEPGSTTPRAWLALIAVLLACAPALMTGIDIRLSSHTMENLAVVVSQETWLRLAEGESRAWLENTNDGEPRLEKPPMVTWLNLLAWSDLDPATASAQQLVFRARCVSVAMGMLMLAAVFLLARMLGDVRFAAIATLLVGSTFFFQRQARTASYDIHSAAWMTLAVALAVWAMRPQSESPPSRGRRIVGWGGFALAMLAAAISKNPLPYLLAVPMLGAAIGMLSPTARRRADAMWLAAATMLSMIPLIAWYAHVLQSFPDSAQSALTRELTQPRADALPFYYYAGLLVLVVPWSLWLVGGLIEPFRIPPSPARRAGLLMAGWFAFILVVVSIPDAKQQRYVLGVMPAVGLLVAMFLRRHDERASSDVPRDDRLFRVLSGGIWIALAMSSAAIAWFLIAPEWISRRIETWMRTPRDIGQPLEWPAAIALSIGLLALCALGWRWHAARPWRSGVLMAGWMLLLMPVYWRQESRIPSPRVEPMVREAARVRKIVGDAPLRSLRWDHADRSRQLNEEFRIYHGRLIRRVWPDEAKAWLNACGGEAYVLAQPSVDRARFLVELGFERVGEVQVDRRDLEELWRWRER